LTIAPTSGSGAGVAVRSDEESLGAFEAVSEPHPQSAELSKIINKAILLSCIYLSNMLEHSAHAYSGLWGDLFTRASFLIGLLIRQNHKQGD
jgi:hypothetical protein